MGNTSQIKIVALGDDRLVTDARARLSLKKLVVLKIMKKLGVDGHGLKLQMSWIVGKRRSFFLMWFILDN